MIDIFLFRNSTKKFLFIILLFLHFDYYCYSQWSHINLPTIDLGSEISFPDSNFGVVAAGSYYKTYDRGNSWMQFNPNISVQNLLFLTRDTGIAFSFNNNEILKSTDGGLNWPTVFTLGNIPANPNLTNFFFLPDHQTGYIIFKSFGLGDSVYSVKTTDGGNSWSVISTFYSADYSGMNNTVKFVDLNIGYFTTAHEIYKTIDGGQTWLLKHTFLNDFVTIQPISADTVIAITQYYDIWKSVNGGQSWIPCTTPVNSPMLDICYSNDTCYIFGGNGINSGFVLSSADQGDNWALAFNDNDTYYRVNASPGKYVFATGDNGAVITNNRLYTSIDKIDKNIFTLYPNPVSDQLNLSIKSNKFDYKIRDAIGNLVLIGKDSKFIQTSFLNNGYYTIEIKSNTSILVRSIVVIH